MKHKHKFERNFKLYFLFMKQNLRAILEYQADFVIMIIASAFTQLLGIAFLWVVYSRIPEIKGWKFWEVAFIYAMIFLTEGFASFLFEGVWSISRLVNMGELDIMLVRPISPVVQIMSSRIGVNGISNIVIGGIIIAQSLHHVNINFTIAKFIMTLLLLLSAIIIRASINFASNASAFWTNSPGNSFGFMVHSICDFAKYPITIYSFLVQAFVTAVIPYAFISFFPAAYIFNKGNLSYVGMLSPIIAIYCITVSIHIFYAGLKKYESAGN